MIVDKVWKWTNTVRVGLDARSSHSQRQSTFPDNVCSYCPPCHGVLHYTTLWKFDYFFVFLEIFFPSVSCKMKKRNEKTNTGEGSTVILGWTLETCAENFPCHQRMHVYNLYAKKSGRTWRIGGSQIWSRTGGDSILCRVCWTHTQKCSRSVTTSTSPHPGKTMPSVII